MLMKHTYDVRNENLRGCLFIYVATGSREIAMKGFEKFYIKIQVVHIV